MLPSNFYISQSAVKDLEREETCPFRWKSQWIDRNPDLQFSNEHTIKGQFFEQLVMGASAHENKAVTDLPRLLNGEKSIDQIRIERQAAKVKAWIEGENQLGLNLLDKQVPIIINDQSGVIDLVMLDISPTSDDVWVIDLKLTKDLTSKRSVYSYGNDWGGMDQLQLTHYGWLYKQKFGITPRLGLLVADYSPKERIEFGEIIIPESKLEERSFRFQEARSAIELYEHYGWIKTPTLKECALCKLECDKRIYYPD